MRRRLVVAVVLATVTLGAAAVVPSFGEKGSCIVHPTRPRCQDAQPSFPIRATFYYPWFPETWTQNGVYPFTNYNPTAGFYDGSDPGVIAEHVAALQYAGQQAGIASWWGPGTPTDGRIPLLLNAASATTFRWALYYEREGYGNPTVSEIQTDLAYIDAQYGTAKASLRVDGHPVLFVYGDSTDGCATADRWAQANSDGRFFIVLKVFAGYKTCASQPQSWHQYAPAVATDSQTGYSYSISPGFYKKDEAAPRLVRDPAVWAQNVQAMVDSQAPWQLTTTFNEWGEGTSVESATQWSSASGYGDYIDIEHSIIGGSPPPTTTTSTVDTTTTTDSTTTTTTDSTTTTGATTTTIGGSANISHVVVIMEENRTWSGVGTGFSTMPYLHSLGGMYLPDWTETDTGENSLTQYIGLTSGRDDPDSISNDCDPSAGCNTTVDNLFRQGRAAGLTMRSYVEGPSTGCSASGNAAKHIPALYYWGGTDRNFCSAEVRPLGDLDVNNLPSFAMVTPDLCNDGHDCGNSTVDNWLSVHLAPILASAEYQAGHVLVNVQYDEDEPVPNLALYKGIAGGSNSAAGSHNQLLSTWEDLLGLPRLTTASSLRGVYGL